MPLTLAREVVAQLEEELAKLQYVTLPDGTVSNCFEAYIVWKRKAAQLEADLELAQNVYRISPKLADAIEYMEQENAKLKRIADVLETYGIGEERQIISMIATILADTKEQEHER